jgi:hypothetical protein
MGVSTALKAPKAIFDALCSKNLANENDIKRICQYQKRTNWLVLFKDNIDVSKFFGKCIPINNYEIDLLDPNEENMSSTFVFRVHWLPVNYSANAFTQIIKDEIKPIAVEASWEHFSSSKVENGVLRLKIKIRKEAKDVLNGFSGKVPLGDRYVFITKLGEKPTCFYCNEVGHTKSICGKWKEKQRETCKKCQISQRQLLRKRRSGISK